MNELTVDNLLLYSQCPMRYYFDTFLGINEQTTTIKGQIEDAIRTSLYSGISSIGDPNVISVTSRIFNSLVDKIQVPSELRGNARKREIYNNSIIVAREKVRYAIGDIIDRHPTSVIAAPYLYDLDISGTIVDGRFDVLLQIDGVYHIVMFDMNQSYPSDEFLANGLRCSISGFVFKRIYRIPTPFKLIHFNIYNTSYFPVDRTDVQLNASGYELGSIAKSLSSTVNNSVWYRSKSFLCNNCYANEPCDDIYRRLAQYAN
jgi:hypothetical protein